VLRRTYDLQHCSVAATLELLGERWTFLILRDVFLGVHRFDAFQGRLGIARNVLTDRLNFLVAEAILERRRYQERPERFEYWLTAKGLELWPIVAELLRWGDKHAIDGEPPLVLRHRDCGGEVGERQICMSCGAELTAADVKAEAGPGARADKLPLAAA
jgi:DNA-binding HxlR family transcriptional regulator